MTPTPQPKALELALLALPDTLMAHPGIKRLMAAYDAELRRQHAEIDRMKQASAEFEGRAVFAENDVAALRMLVERLRADAERYRWLRHALGDGKKISHWSCSVSSSDELDAYIDAAREAKG